MDPSFLKVVKTLAIEDAEEEKEHSEFVQLALSNSVVLRKIFKLLPASTLKSCSLVNKLWKSECYSYCRDHRKWMAKINALSPCASLVQFNELVGSMAPVSYNGLTLHVDLTRRYISCQCNSPEELFRNVMDKLTWKHLDILINFEGDFNENKPIPCAAVRFGITLLEQKIAGLGSLKFHLYDDLQPRVNSNWPPALKNLQTICFPQPCQRGYNLRHTTHKCFFTRLINSAPNLKEITGMINHLTLPSFPEEKWGYVKDFSYSAPATYCTDELKITSQFMTKTPGLRNFSVHFGPLYRATGDPICNALIELSQMTMEEFEIRSSAVDFKSMEDSLKIPQLPKLRQLRLDMSGGFAHAIEKAQFLLNQHDSSGFPQLEEFRLSVSQQTIIRTVFTMVFDYGEVLPRPELRDESDSHEIERLELLAQSFPSISKLQLDLDPAYSSFLQIESLFPAVTEMKIICTPTTYHDPQSRLPHKQIFRLWQNLETVSICADYVDPGYNLDASFCGLDEKEVELLAQEDDNFLMAVQLVPVAPCVLTMRNLRSFSYKYRSEVEARERRPFMTRVGQMLARRHLPNVLVIVE